MKYSSTVMESSDLKGRVDFTATFGRITVDQYLRPQWNVSSLYLPALGACLTYRPFCVRSFKPRVIMWSLMAMFGRSCDTELVTSEKSERVFVMKG